MLIIVPDATADLAVALLLATSRNFNYYIVGAILVSGRIVLFVSNLAYSSCITPRHIKEF